MQEGESQGGSSASTWPVYTAVIKQNEHVDLGKEDWTLEIRPRASFFQLNLKELLDYRDLIFLFVKRNYKTMYKQTVLGPLWILLSPLLTTGMFTIVFGKIADIPTDGVPDYLFYMAGNILWAYFSGCLTAASGTFIGNAGLFGKVYFPRVIMPVSASISKLVTFGAQFLLFFLLLMQPLIKGTIHITWWCAATPILLLQLALLAMGTGMILASMTAKYRDLQVLVGFGVQLWMYATPIVYPLSEIPGKWKWLMLINPASASMECFRAGWLGSGTISFLHLSITMILTGIIFLFGLLVFNRTQRNFMDSI